MAVQTQDGRRIWLVVSAIPTPVRPTVKAILACFRLADLMVWSEDVIRWEPHARRHEEHLRLLACILLAVSMVLVHPPYKRSKGDFRSACGHVDSTE